MKSKIKIIALVMTAAIALSACPKPRGTPAIAPTTTQRIYPYAFDHVWDATLAVVTEDLKYPVQVVERQTGLISTEWVTYERKAGNYEEAEQSTENPVVKPILVSYRVMVMVKITPEGTMVRVRRYQLEWIDRWTPVPTDLTFERQFLLLVDRRLGYNPQTPEQ